MESCGIGIERILCAAIERFHDQDGMMLPAAIAPFQVVIAPANSSDAAHATGRCWCCFLLTPCFVLCFFSAAPRLRVAVSSSVPWLRPRYRIPSTCACHASTFVWSARPTKAARSQRKSGSLRQPMA